jgi:hypothetical protein
MRESRPYGSVRGALRNERPYRDRCLRQKYIVTLSITPAGGKSSLMFMRQKAGRIDIPAEYQRCMSAELGLTPQAL